MSEGQSIAQVTKPRGIISILLIGLLLGPLPLMLWIGRAKLGLIYFAATILAAGLFLILVIEGLVAPIASEGVSVDAMGHAAWGVCLVALGHAFVIRRESLSRPWYSRWYVAILLVPLVAAYALAFFVRTFLYQPFNIPSGAMYPTLVIGDYVFVSKRAYGFGKHSFNFSLPAPLSHAFKFGPVPIEGRILVGRLPERGDVAVFKLPRDNETDYVKRVIGLPGDRIQMRDGVVYINGEPVKKERVADYDNADGAAYGGLSEIPMYRETLPNGVSYFVLDARPSGEADNTEEYLVPSGHYLMMGDNRDNTLDSRFPMVGTVPEENFLGPVVLRFWNDRGLSLADRPPIVEK